MKKIYYFLLLLHISLYGETIIEKSFLIDEQSAYTNQNIYENKDKFSTLAKDKNAFGFLPHTVWIHLKLTNNGTETLSNVVELPYPLLDHIEVLKYENTQLIESYKTGDLKKFNTRKEESNTFVISYELQAFSSKELILGISSQGPLNLKMNFMSNKEFAKSSKENSMVLGIYYGAIIIMLIYNLILYFIIKEKVYFNYVLFHFFYLFAQLALNGLAFEYIWPNTPEINSYFFLSMMILINYYAVLFSVLFLDTKKYHPKLYYYFKIFMFIFIVLFPLNFILPYELMARAVTMFSGILFISLFLSGVYTLIKNNTASSKFFVTAWSFLLLGLLVTQFSFWGFLPISFFTLYANQIGALIELALLSIALAYRYNTLFLKLTKKEAQLRLFNEELEETVKERTQTISNKNTLLSKEVNNKNILLKELFHRVKNNLQIISSILYMQSKKVEHKEANEVLQNSIQIISSMGMIHEKLYNSDDLEFIDFREYLDSLISYMTKVLKEKKIEFNIECKNVLITLKNAVPLGLVVNEIITNSLKHAFNEHSTQTMEINIEIDKDENDILSLKIFDNGVGIQLDKLKKNFGFKLIESLATYQLKASLDFYNMNGFGYYISFQDQQEK